MITIQRSDHNDPMSKVSATFKCVVCNQPCTVSKTSRTLVGGSRGKPSWNISNFQTHFRLHFKSSDSKRQNIFQFLPDKSGGETVKEFKYSNAADAAFQKVSSKRKMNVISDSDGDTEIKDFNTADDAAFQKNTAKRKINVISDSEDDTESENVERNVNSGESLSGVSERQDAPEL